MGNGQRYICPKCRGNSRIRCPICEGSGTQGEDRGYDVTKVCQTCKGGGRVPLTSEEIRANAEAVRLEAERRKEWVRLEAESRRAEVARRKELPEARARLKSAIAAADTLAPSLKNSVGMEMILIKPGAFGMGSDDGNSNEKPVHEVVILKPFYLGKYEVTQAQWRVVMGNSPSHFKGDNLPVESVSFEDTQEFCRKLSQMTGEEYRLPTEAVWEYAARAGTTGAYAGNLDSMAWYSDNSAKRTHAVGTKQPNAWGLYDVHGNGYEWCEDWYGERYYSLSPAPDPRGPGPGSIRVLRGGGWSAYALAAARRFATTSRRAAATASSASAS